VWDWIEGEWAVAIRANLLPGRIVCVAAACGGYRTERGFDPDWKETVTLVPLPAISADTQALDEADDQQDGEHLSFNPWKTIGCHTAEVASVAGKIAKHLELPKALRDVLELAALWHDWGKSHPAFQGAMRGPDRPARYDLAKGPVGAWRKPPDMYRFLDDSETRPAFRHELASALGLFAILQTYTPQHLALLGSWSEVLTNLGKSPVPSEPLPEPSPLIQRLLDCKPEAFDLLVYLVASHHGKVRVTLHAAPKDQEYRDRDGRGLPIRGIREGDRLPSVSLIPGTLALPQATLTLSPAAVGLSDRTGISWRERCLGLVERYGPAGLAFLEAILRASDVRASRLMTNDPALVLEAST
jgi:CRISPR-associated endonuclease/helicase Cas3